MKSEADAKSWFDDLRSTDLMSGWVCGACPPPDEHWCALAVVDYISDELFYTTGRFKDGRWLGRFDEEIETTVASRTYPGATVSRQAVWRWWPLPAKLLPTSATIGT